ncbi:hypothetical protein HDU91_007491, partial [Kappamyces sp. JEL0680]
NGAGLQRGFTIQDLTEKSKKDDEFLILGTEAAMSIINIQTRKQTLRKSLFNRMLDEKELHSMMQTHKESFTQFIWKRRVQTRKDLRSLFQSGPGILGRFGDLICESNIEAIQSFERSNCSKLCHDAIEAMACEVDDIAGFFKQTILLQPPRNPALMVSPTRLEFKLDGKNSSMKWHCVTSTSGPWAIKLYSKALVRSICEQTLVGLKLQETLPTKDADFSYVNILARLFDLVHPTHQLQAAILAYPMYGAQILKRRILSLSYDIGGANEENVVLDHRLTMDLARQMQKKLEKEMRPYFEVIVPYKTSWRIGFGSSSKMTTVEFPGKDSHSFGFGQNGNIYINDTEYRYLDNLTDTATENQLKVVGVLVDLYHGTIHLVVDGITHPPAFGKGASSFPPEEQERQRILITKQQIIPMFSLQECESDNPQDAAIMRVNFGSAPFYYSISCTPLQTIHQQLSTKGIDSIVILDSYGPNSTRDKISQEEDEKINMVRVLAFTLVAGEKLFPNLAAAGRGQELFPVPAIAWRKYQGRLMRARIRKEQYLASCVIQRMARKKLRKIRELKNIAAGKIQKVWRRKRLIWVALLRCIYRQTIKSLHSAATIIQRKWRHWHSTYRAELTLVFKNSPLASKYQKKVEGTRALQFMLDLESAVNTIIRWWRPFYARLVEIRRNRWQAQNATIIQRAWKGYKLRSLLRKDVRERLAKVGKAILKARYCGSG